MFQAVSHDSDKHQSADLSAVVTADVMKSAFVASNEVRVDDRRCPGWGSDSIPLSGRVDSTQVVDFLKGRQTVEKAETAQLGADCSKIVQKSSQKHRTVIVPI
jgi:hypothetical protein